MKQKKVTCTITNTLVTVVSYDKNAKSEAEETLILHSTFKSADGLKRAVEEALTGEGKVIVEIVMIEKKPTTYEMETEQFIKLATLAQ